MDIKWLSSFVLLAQELHFGRAAARLHIVQPALSYQIRQLEESLAVRLLDRSTRTVSLTPAGVLFLEEARLALQHIELARQVARDAEAGTAGPLRIGFVDNAVWSVFTPVVRAFRSKFPQVEVDLKQMPRIEQLEALTSGRLDIGVLPGPVMKLGLSTRVLTRAPLEVALPPQHPLASRSSVPIALLANESFVAFPSASDPRRIDELVVAICASAGFTPVLGQAVQQMHTALALVSSGFGIAIVPRWMRHAWARDIEFRPLTPVTHYELLIASPEHRTTPVVQTFRKLVDQVLPGLGDPMEGEVSI